MPFEEIEVLEVQEQLSSSSSSTDLDRYPNTQVSCSSIVDTYGDYKSESQLYFSDKLKERKKWSLWLTVMFVILTWNEFIIGIEIDPIIEYDLQKTLRCKIPDLEVTNWSFKQIKAISHYSNKTSICYYYDHDYKRLSQLPFEEAYNITQSFNKTKILKCNGIVLHVTRCCSSYPDMQKVLCNPNVPLYYFVGVGNIVGIAVYGFFADIYGRKAALLATLPLSVIGSILSSITPTYWLLYISKIATAASFKAAACLSLTLLLELVHNNIRIYMTPFTQFGYCLGMYTKAAFMTECHLLSIRNFQWVIAVTLLLPISTFWLLPESPHWLLCKKKWNDMIVVLNEMNYPATLQLTESQKNGEVLSMTLKQIFKILSKPMFRKKLISGAFLLSLTFLIYYEETLRLFDDLDSELNFSLVGGTCMIANMVLVPIMLKHLGRPMCICWCLLILSFFYCASTLYSTQVIVRGIIACICLTMSQNAIVVNALLIIETFPTRVRVSAVCICRIISIVVILVTLILDDFLSNLLKEYESSVYACFMLIAAFICVFITDTGNISLPDTQLEAIMHF